MSSLLPKMLFVLLNAVSILVLFGLHVIGKDCKVAWLISVFKITGDYLIRFWIITPPACCCCIGFPQKFIGSGMSVSRC